MYAYHSPKPPGQQEIQTILQDALAAHNRFDPDLELELQVNSDAPLVLTLLMAWICELAREMDAVIQGGKALPLRQYLSLRTIESLAPHAPPFCSCEGAALFLAAKHGRLDVIAHLFDINDSSADTLDGQDGEMLSSKALVVYSPEVRLNLAHDALRKARRNANEEVGAFLERYKESLLQKPPTE